MYDYYFTFRSVTAALGAARALERAGVPSATVRTPKELRHKGCGYSLRVREELLPEAGQALEAAGASYQKLYRRADNGSWQEVPA
ncbi:MAG: DUF3343 domain-containing protein [Oscillospiraceae bacterium]|nr:DUF3343 domain-containing protein [Oscillospiraceae bacterium]